MAILTLDHVNIRTTQLDRTRQFFTEVLGLTVGWRPPFTFGGAWFYVGEQDVVHVIEVKDQHAPSSGSVLDHFAFGIDDYEGVRAKLDAAGMTYKEVMTPGTTTRQMFVTELNGVNIELNCRGERLS